MSSRAPSRVARDAPALLRLLLRWRAVLGLVLGASAEGCALTQRTAIVVEAAQGPQRVVFRISSTPFFYGLTVVRCDRRRTMWVVGTPGDSTPPPARIVYGEAPKGYLTKTGPLPLTPGCYRVIASGPAEARFIVNADGTVAALERARAPTSP
jgi:hypothetical protein